MNECYGLYNGVKLASEILGISSPYIKMMDINKSKINAMFIKKNNIIIFDIEWIKKASLAELLIACFHESRHAFQWEVINNKHSEIEYIEKTTISIWTKEFLNYNTPTRDSSSHINYLLQEIEIDAIAFSYKAMLELFGITICIPESIKDQVLKRAMIIKI